MKFGGSNIAQKRNVRACSRKQKVHHVIITKTLITLKLLKVANSEPTFAVYNIRHDFD